MARANFQVTHRLAVNFTLGLSVRLKNIKQWKKKFEKIKIQIYYHFSFQTFDLPKLVLNDILLRFIANPKNIVIYAYAL